MKPTTFFSWAFVTACLSGLALAQEHAPSKVILAELHTDDSPQEAAAVQLPEQEEPAKAPEEAKEVGKITITIEYQGRSTSRTFEIPASYLHLAEPALKLAGLFPAGEETASKAYLGVSLEEVPPTKDTPGIKITGVLPGSPAAQAELQRGDVLKKLDDQLLINPPQLTALIRTRKPGDTVTLTYERGEHTHTATLTLASLPAQGLYLAASPKQKDGELLRLVAQALSQLSGAGISLSESLRSHLYNPSTNDILLGNVIRFGEDGKVTVEEVAKPSKTLEIKDFPQLQKMLQKTQEQLHKTLSEVEQSAEIEALRSRVAELRQSWLHAQQQLLQSTEELQRQLSKKLKEQQSSNPEEKSTGKTKEASSE